MKKLIHFSLVLSLIFTFSFTEVNSQWVKQNSGTQQNLRSVYFISSDLGWAVGDNGTIIKTTNGGINWTPQTSGTSLALNQIQFRNNLEGVIVGGQTDFGGSVVLYTKDGGNTWKITSTPSPDVLYSVFLINSVGFAVGLDEYQNHTSIMKTTNYGISWTQIANIYRISLFSVYFPSASTGYSAGAYTILKTINSGNSWFVILNAGGVNYLKSIYFSSPEVGWVVGGSDGVPGGPVYGVPPSYTFLKTTNGGQTWNAQILNLNNKMMLNSLFFYNGSVGYIVGKGGNILKTTDNGNNWLTQNISTNNWNSVFFISENVGWIVGAGGLIIKTVNGGITSVKNDANIPTEFSLSQNYPNPFNPSTKIKFDIPKQSHVKLSVYDILGREIEKLVDKEMLPESYEATFDVKTLHATSLPSGVYFYRIETDGFVKSSKMVLMK